MAALHGKEALAAEVGTAKFHADRTRPDHRVRRLLAEFIGMSGLTFVLSGGAAVLARYGGAILATYQIVLILLLVSALGWSQRSTSSATSRRTSTRP